MRVAITGMGAVCPLGATVGGAMEALWAGHSAVVPRPADAEVGLAPTAVARCPDVGPISGVAPHLLKGVDPVSLFSLAAAFEALAQSEEGSPLPRERMPVVWGCSMGGASTQSEAYDDLLTRRKKRCRPASIPFGMPSAPAFHIAHHLGLLGPSMTLSIACASSAIAMAHAARMIDHGECDAALAGGCESMFTPVVMKAWQMTQAICELDAAAPEQSCRPFSARRSGFAMGEGSACVVLESERSARARGARIFGWLRGIGHTTDASHISRPDASAQAAAMRGALAHAQVEPRDIAYVNAHGTATLVGDVSEAQALRAVFAAGNPQVPVSSTKAAHGHLVGGAGALEAIITLQALRGRRLPGNPHSPDVDPAMACLNIFAGCRELPVAAPRIGMSNSFAFGGVNAVLVIEAAG